MFEYLTLKDRLLCRLVSKSWKKNIDGRLEAFTLSSFSRWRPYTDYPNRLAAEVTPKFKLCKSKLNPKLISESNDRIAISTFPANQLPFASKSLAVVEATNREQSTAQKTNLTGIFSSLKTCGSQLTSLSIAGRSSFSLDLELTTLISILSRTPNLKALHMYRLQFMDHAFDTPLPALPQLKNFLIGNVLTYRKIGKKGNNSIESSFFEAYIQKLVTLEIGNFFGAGSPVPLKAVQQNLTQLKLYKPRRNFLDESEPAPLLQRLAITEKYVYTKDDFQAVLGYIDKFSDSLVHLHLDVKWYNLTGYLPYDRKKCWRGTTYCDGERMKVKRERDSLRKQVVEMCNGSLYASKTFPHLKTLAICYPNEEQDLETGLLRKILLVKFPALENLLFFNCRWVGITEENRLLTTAARVGPFLERENYWQICSNFKRITAVEDANYDEPKNVVFEMIR